MAARPKLLLVWDFDRSFLQEDCEWSTFAHFGIDDRASQLAGGAFKGRWPACTDLLFDEISKRPVTKEQLCEIVGSLEPWPAMRQVAEAVGAAAAQGLAVEQRVLSDANTELIEIVLARQGLREAFSTVLSNPARWEGDRLRVEPYLAQGVAAQLAPASSGGPRTKYCPPNLCKGAVLRRWLQELAPERCVYVGDGRGDYGAAVQLREGDQLWARQDFPLHELLSVNPRDHCIFGLYCKDRSSDRSGRGVRRRRGKWR